MSRGKKGGLQMEGGKDAKGRREVVRGKMGGLQREEGRYAECPFKGIFPGIKSM
jgi:hypothetical protein